MKKPQIKLKSIQTFKGEDGLGFNADLFIDGTKCFHVCDGGYGGGLNFTLLTYKNPEEALINAKVMNATDFISKLPKEPLIIAGEHILNSETNEPMYVEHNMETVVNELFREFIVERDKKTFEKLCIKGISWGIPNGYQYQTMKFNKPLSEMGKTLLQNYVDQIKVHHLKQDEVILNKNLTAMGIII